MARRAAPETALDSPAPDEGQTVQTAQEATQTDETPPEAPAPAAPPESEQEAPEPPQEGQEPAQAAPPVIVYVNYEAGLNLRDGPHRDFNSLTVIPDGEPLEVLDLPEGAEVPGWALVRCGEAGAGLVGWVNTDYVREG